MRKRFLGAMLLALGIGLFGGWGSAQANSVPEPTQSMLHVCCLKDAHVNPAACEVVRMPDAFEPAKAVVTSSVDFPDFQVVALDLREVSAEAILFLTCSLFIIRISCVRRSRLLL